MVFGQGNCPQIVSQALAAATNTCIDTQRNLVCYGNFRLDVQTRAGQDQNFAFDNQGDKAPLKQIASLKLSSYNEANNEWGVAVMSLQATLPDTSPGQNVTVLLFGNVEIADATSEGSKPMSAFYFQSGIGDAPCKEAPDSGILIRTPKGAGQVTLSMNEVIISLGSTAFLQAQPGNTMSISMLEGQATVANQTVTAGSKVEIPITDTLSPSGPVSEPIPYDFSVIARLPTTYLDSLVNGTQIETACTISANHDQVTLRVGPGQNRNTVAFMPQGDFAVTGQARVGDTVWFQLAKNEVLPQKANQVKEIWVDSNNVNQNGSCTNISVVATPAIVHSAPKATVTPVTHEQVPNIVPTASEAQEPVVIEFWADIQNIISFGCTTLHWHVVGISEVYLDDMGVTGPVGGYEVCLSQTTTYTLKVVLKTGETVYRQVTIKVS